MTNEEHKDRPVVHAEVANFFEADVMNHSDEKLPRTELLWQFEQAAREYAASLDPDTEPDIIGGLLPALLEEVPLAAFDPILPEHEGIIFFNQEITEGGVEAACNDLMRCHLNLKEGKPIWIHFSSLGGSIFDGLVLCSTIHQIQRQGRDVNIHIQGVAMSMGSLIAQVCDTRTIEESAFFMLHEMSDNVSGNLSSLKNEVKFSQVIEETCLRLYSARTGKPLEYYATKTAKGNWYMTAAEAKEEGLVDEVIPMPRFTYTPPAPARPRRARRTTKESTDDAT